MKKNFKWVILIVLVATFFVSCGEKKANIKSIAVNLTNEPPTIDPVSAGTVEATNVSNTNFETLFIVGEDSSLIPGAALSYKVSEDGLVYTFELRKDGKWSDGKPVTANDFVYAYRRAVDANTKSNYSDQFFYIKNGEEIYNGKAKPEKLGVKAIDDYTFEITLGKKTPYFINLITCPLFAPVRQDIVENNPEWINKPETYIGNGPFMLKEIKPKEGYTFVKNPNYWNAANIKIDEIRMSTIPDSKTYMASFSSGEIDIVDNPPPVEIPGLLESGTAKRFPFLGVYGYIINFTDKNSSPEVTKFLHNPKVRKALTLAIDRESLIQYVIKGGQLPGTGLIPSGTLTSTGKIYETKKYVPSTANIEEAKKLLAEAGYGDPASMPTITLTYNTKDLLATIAQAVQDMWKTNLGLNVELKNLEWAVFLSTTGQHDFDIASFGWTEDYNDPMTFFNVFGTGNQMNKSGYANPKYQKLLDESYTIKDQNKRTELMHQAEDIFMNDNFLIPIYFYTNIIASNPKVKGWYRSAAGIYYFQDAYIEENIK